MAVAHPWYLHIRRDLCLTCVNTPKMFPFLSYAQSLGKRKSTGKSNTTVVYANDQLEGLCTFRSFGFRSQKIQLCFQLVFFLAKSLNASEINFVEGIQKSIWLVLFRQIERYAACFPSAAFIWGRGHTTLHWRRRRLIN